MLETWSNPRKMEKNMNKLAAVALGCALLGSTLLAAQTQPQVAQTQPQAPAKKIEALFKTAQIPFTSSSEANYVAVITAEDESERFHVYVSTFGDDPNNEKLQVAQLYFVLGSLPKDTPVPLALTKQIAEWNVNMRVGKVIVANNSILYTDSLWLSRTDADGLNWVAAVGHYISKSLRKDVAPYLKP
jgi:hypothetical protein